MKKKESKVVTKKLNPGWVEIAIVTGVEGDSLYVNEHRCAGPKPWGGGSVKWTKNVRAEDFLKHVHDALEVYLPNVKSDTSCPDCLELRAQGDDERAICDHCAAAIA